MVSLPLTGRQVVLRDWIPQDIPIYRSWMRPGREWQAFDGPYYPHPSLEETERTLTAVARRIREGDWPEPRKVLAVASSDSNQLIGRLSRVWQSEETHWLSIGVVIFDSALWGRGLGYEALGLWSEYLFEALPQLARLDLRTWSGNRGMVRLAEKLGYRREATFRRARIVNGEYFDGLGFGVLREEWLARYPSGFAAALR